MAKAPPKRSDDSDTGVLTKSKPKTQKPSLYKVLLLNDDYTPMEFVVLVLQAFFNKTGEDAYRIMLHVHQKGVGICGVYSYEVAETKVTQVMDFAKEHNHPLQCTMEKE
jgi:ATP-dependent Clp protease adaptor protein ClpS